MKPFFLVGVGVGDNILYSDRDGNLGPKPLPQNRYQTWQEAEEVARGCEDLYPDKEVLVYLYRDKGAL